MSTTPQAEATYVLTIVADSGYESTMEGRCDAEQYALAVKALHEPAQARADLEAENARLREALESFTKSDYIKKQHPKRYAAARAALEPRA